MMTEQTMGTYSAATFPANMTIGDLAEILFCSSLQPSDAAGPDAVHAAVSASLRSHHGEIRECAEELAARYGKEPEIACLRMRWARKIVATAFPDAGGPAGVTAQLAS